MTETQQIDEILTIMSNGQLIGPSKDTHDLEKTAIKKLVAFGLISPRSNTFDLTDKGYKAVELGGFQQFLDFQEKQQQPTPTQHLTINAPVIGSQLGLSSDFGDLESNHNSKNLDATDHTPKAKKQDQNIQELTIWNKIYKWTDHKLISGIILLILGFYISRLFIWFGWLPCP